MEDAVPEEGSTESRLLGQENPADNSSNLTTNGDSQAKGFGDWLRSLIGMKGPEGSFKEALQEVLEDHADDLSSMRPEERRIFNNLLDFGDLEISDIMTPQADIIAVEINADLDELKTVLLKERHTRMPVYEETIDHVKGFIHAKDLVPFLGTNVEGFTVRDMMRDILFVPQAMRVVDLLLKMRMAGVHIAIVVDEYGGTSGLVTLEDLFEEIVGDIHDEHDDENDIAQQLAWDSQGSITLDAKTRIDQLEEQLDIRFTEEDDDSEQYDTLGGLVFAHLGRVPIRGEETTHAAAGLLIEVLDADARRVKRVRLTRIPESDADSTAQATG